MESDAELLHSFAATRSDPAFAALVQRHLPLVYGTACRRLNGDTHLAQDVSQLVFALLARKAGSLRHHPTITGWLYLTTQQLAAKTMRTEQRRGVRENAAETLRLQSDDPAAWERLRPVIDDALLDLPENDRLAILLRYFQSEPFAAIGARLGLSENAARMKTDRALERLQSGLARRGITSTAAAFGAALAANAAVAAPAGLAATITANAALGSAGTLFLMSTSTLKFGVISATLVAGAAGFFWQSQTGDRLRDENAALRTELAGVRRSALASDRKAAAASRELADLRTELERLRTAAVAPVGAPSGDAVSAWTARVASLKQRLVQQPEQNIPEFRFLSEDDWLDAARQPLETDIDYRKAMSKLRSTAEANFGTKQLQPALKRFVQATGNGFPGDLGQLQSYFEDSVDSSILERWAVMPADAVRNIRVGGTAMVSQKAPVDSDYDTRRVYGANGSGSTNWGASVERTAPGMGGGAGGGAMTGGAGAAPTGAAVSTFPDTIMTQPKPAGGP